MSDLAPGTFTPPRADLASELVPSRKQQSWGALLSIVVIVLMIVVGALYAWGARIAEREGLDEGAESGPAAL